MIKFKKYNDIKDWLSNMDIKDYSISDNGYIYVDNNVDLSNIGMVEMPVQFWCIKGSFYCESNYIKNLEGFPMQVYGDFKVGMNEIETMKDGPLIVGGDYDISFNNLKDLKYAPNKCSSFDCANNQITDLKGFNITEISKLDIAYNLLENLDGLEKINISPDKVNYTNNPLRQESVDRYWEFHLEKTPNLVNKIRSYHKVSKSLEQKYKGLINYAIGFPSGNIIYLSKIALEQLKRNGIIKYSEKYNEHIFDDDKTDFIKNANNVISNPPKIDTLNPRKLGVIKSNIQDDKIDTGKKPWKDWDDWKGWKDWKGNKY